MRGLSIKRKIITFGRIINTGLHNLVRNVSLTIAAIAVMIVTLTVLVSAVIANYSFQETIERISRDLTISIFLLDEAPEATQNELLAEVENNQFVDTVSFKSKGRALAEFKISNADNQRLLEGLSVSDSNPLPASYEVRMNDIDEYQQVIDIASQEKYAEVVRSTSDNENSRAALEQFTAVQDSANRASIVLGTIFATIALLVIYNTIRMAIFTRRDEIEIMKLIGAMPSYIRGPILFEAAMYGVIASIVCLSVVYGFVLPWANDYFADSTREFSSGAISYNNIFPDGVVVYFTSNWYVVFAVTLATGVGIGLFSAAFAIAKYLRFRRW